MTTATAILIVGLAFVASNIIMELVGWFVVFPWQQRVLSREQFERFPWKVKGLDEKP
jgi:hypothetical protein